MKDSLDIMRWRDRDVFDIMKEESTQESLEKGKSTEKVYGRNKIKDIKDAGKGVKEMEKEFT